MTNVVENLKEAINGESTAKKKYELFSEKAREEKLPEIAHLFKAVAYAESIHIKNHLRALSEITGSEIQLEDIVDLNEEEIRKSVNSTRNNLIQAISGETYEFKTMYKSFMKDAKKENVFLAEYSFDLARKAEKVHSKLFIDYLKKLDKNKDFESIDIYVCTICGNVELERAPEVCPNCDHDQQFFEKI
ncbi:MAG: rubrerythrin family protein [Promethearchaeota archaeon]|nr:MAG: rubrerythrin family protein [Candidatus Lokiarchaeota archaeon]